MSDNKSDDARGARAPNKAPEARLTPERWQKIKDLFADAQDREPKDRAAFLRGACGGDESLLAEVESLLAAATSEEATDTVAKSPARDPLIGRRVGAYKIEQQIGHGGMASVYLASRADEEYQKQVAIKLLRPDLDSKELLRRFRNERQTLATLDHPNIVKLLDGGSTEEGLPYLVMDYVEGSPIDEYCDSYKLSIEERLRLFCKACAGMECAHQNLVIHRDLKPSNILVSSDGAPKLLDFGIAKVLSADSSGEPLATQTGSRRMTPAYASPEQVKGEPVTAATDIYSLGVVLYELLTGHRPYKLKQHTPMEFERAICEEEPEKPSTAVDRVETENMPDGTTINRTPESVSRTREGQPEKLRRCLRGDLDTIVLKGLEKEPQRRFASVQAFSEDIQRHLNHLPVKARRSTLGYRASKFVKRHKAEVLAAAIVVFAALGGTVFARYLSSHRSAPISRIQSLAVLPLANLSGDPAQEYFSDGITDALITDLAQIPSLKVISRTSTMRYKKTDKSLPEIARELNVDGIIEGTVQRSGDRVRVTAQLIHGASDKHVWAKSYERDVHDFFTLERDVTQEIARQVQAQLTTQNRAQLAQTRPVNVKALEAYLQGSYFLNKGSGDKDMGKAQEYFQQATDADPNFAAAYVGMAESHWALFRSSSDDRAIRRASAEKAVALDPSSSDAQCALGEMKSGDWDWRGAEEQFRLAIALNPNSANAHDDLGVLLDLTGRLDEGWREAQIAQELDPNNDHLSTALEARWQYDRAIELLLRDSESHPHDGFIHYYLFRDYALNGMYKESVHELEQSLNLFGYSEIAANVHGTFAASGYRRAMREWAKDLEHLHTTNQVFVPRILAGIYAGLGEKDRAFYWLEQGYQHRDRIGRYGSVAWMKADHNLDPLREDPRFGDLVRRVGLPP